MKKIIFTAGILSILILMSCKKNYTCVCTDFYNGADTTWTKLRGERDIETRKEKDAVAECDELDGDTQVYLTESYGLNCELK